ncbi:LuxR family transcriptional regulator [Streptomyces sp. S.PB5]|uniref:ATP-binding protein n=1 Tax=Streptomyces sp. S.PB5 TaxID=3020844 RepID=UPI0025B036B8|nr:LuxR family transcriptional regulator [Streptomyces sp. S.PB5]MDN3028566.1 AAA family ATPase [Streptomyces sp. S.PB5]
MRSSSGSWLPSPGSSLWSPGSLYGRQAETVRLRARVEELSRRGGAVLVHGEPGIGKTALLEDAARCAQEAGARVLRTLGVESETLIPFAGLHQLVFPLRALVTELPEEQRDALQAALGLTDTPVPDLFLVGLAVLDLLTRAAADSPVVLVADDVHWLDGASSEILAFLSRRLDSEPVLLLAAMRDGYPPSHLTTASLPSLAVGPLSDTASAQLLDARAPEMEQGAKRRLLREAAGNPLALTELPVDGTDLSTPPSPTATDTPMSRRLQNAFTARLSTLPEVTRHILLTAACDDGGSLPEILRAASLNRQPPAVAADLAPATAAGLMEVTDDSVRFRHPLMRSAIRQSASAELRRATHAALARCLPTDSDRQAWHAAAAADRPDEQLAARLETAADRAHRRGGAADSVLTLEQSARLSTDPALRVERLLKAADQAVDAGHRHLVARLLEAAAPDAASPQQRARLQWIRGGLEDGMRDASEGTAALTRLARSVHGQGDPEPAVRILWSSALRCFWSDPDARARADIVALADALPFPDDDPRILAILAYAQPVLTGRRVHAHLRTAARRTAGDAQADRLVGSAAVLAGDLELARELSQLSVPGLRTQGRLGLLARALGAQAWSGAHLADLGATIPVAQEASRLAHETGQTFLHGLNVATEARTAALRGHAETALELAAEAERIGLPVGARPVLATAQLARGLAATVLGRFDEACAHLLRMHDPADPAHQPALRCYALIELADAAVHCGDTGLIRPVVEDLEQAGTLTPSPALHTGLRYARAVLAADEDAEPLFRQALDAGEGSAFDRARVQLAYGQWLRRQRRVTDCRTELRAAREAFDTLGTVPWSDRARQELLASGEHSSCRAPDARDRLTPQELQIAQMAAEGLTNREIGQRLYLSHRTVSTHLHRVFPKLGITSRSGLASFFPHSGRG